MSTRAPVFKPAETKEWPCAAINRGKASGPMTRPVAASIRQEPEPSRLTNRPAKFPSAEAVTSGSLGKLRLDNAHDLANIFHFHHIIHIEADFEGQFQITGKRQMAHGIPTGDIAGGGLDGDQLRVDVEGGFEDLPDFG